MINIDWDIVDKFLEAGCDGTQIAAYFGCSQDTIYRQCQDEKNVGFADYKAAKRSKGDLKLLSVQFESAIEDKDKAMMIWLGKQRLGQKDKNEVTAEITTIKKPSWFNQEVITTTKEAEKES